MKGKRTIKFCSVLFFLLISISDTQAQSFLSQPGTDVSSQEIRLGEEKKKTVESTAGTSGVRELYKGMRILSTVAPSPELPVEKQQKSNPVPQPDRERFFETDPSAEPVTREFDATSLIRALDLINRGEYRLAQALLENLNPKTVNDLSENERFELLELQSFLLLKINFHLGEFQKVIDMAPRYFERYSNGRHYFQSYYYFAVSLHNQKKPLQLVSMVTEDFFSNLSKRESQNLRTFLIEDAVNKGHLVVAYNFILDSNGELIPGFDHFVTEIIEKIEDIDDIDAILNENPADLVKSHAYLRKVQILIRDGDYQLAQDFLSVLLNSDYIDAATLAELQGFQNFIDIALNTDPYKIGVILPLSHKFFGRLARQALDGLELALQSRSFGGHSIQLVIKDSALNPTTGHRNEAVQLTAEERSKLVKNQVRELVEEDRVIAILGPLAKDTSLAAADIAEIYKVPIISFSITEEIGKDRPFLFRFQRNRIIEAENLARYALDYLQAERFVLFYINDSSGKGFEVMQTFSSKIKEYGGVIAGISPIEYNQVDFKNSYLSITGGFQKRNDTEETAFQTEEQEPIIDFDLMFVPVPLNTLKIILDFNRSFDAEDVWVLSGSEINVRENQLLDHTRRLRFIDAFPIGGTSTYLQPFYEEHWRSYNFRPGYLPPTSYTIYAYEALEMVSKLLNDARFHNRESLRNAIHSLKDFPVLNGSVNSRQNGELIKKLNILKIKSKDTVALF